MNTPFYIAKKYFGTKKKTSSANFINVTAILGVIIGTTALFIILSTFAGLEKLAVEMLFEKNSTLKVEPVYGKKISNSSVLLKSIQALPEVTSVSSLIEEKVQLLYKGRGDFIYLRGIDDEYKKTNLDSIFTFYEGFPKEYNQLVLTQSVFSKLDIMLGDAEDSVKLYVPKAGKIQVNNPQNAFKIKNVVITDIFYSDLPVAYTPIELTRNLLDLKEDETYALEIKHDHSKPDEEIKVKLETLLGNQYKILTQKDQLGSFYKMIKTEHLMVYLIFTLILIISTFNLIGAIIILIIEKREDLVTLHALGMDFRSIKQIFLIEGFMVSFIGGLIGLCLGFGLELLQQQYGLVRVNELLPYPTEFTWTNFTIVLGTVVIIGTLASLIGTAKLTKDFLKK